MLRREMACWDDPLVAQEGLGRVGWPGAHDERREADALALVRNAGEGREGTPTKKGTTEPGVDPLFKGVSGLRQSVVGPGPFSARLHKTCCPQYPKVLGNLRLRFPKTSHQFADTQLALNRQRGQHPKTERIRQSTKRLCRRNRSVRFKMCRHAHRMILCYAEISFNGPTNLVVWTAQDVLRLVDAPKRETGCR
jgi:hypothetical protein